MLGVCDGKMSDDTYRPVVEKSKRRVCLKSFFMRSVKTSGILANVCFNRILNNIFFWLDFIPSFQEYVIHIIVFIEIYTESTKCRY